MINNYDNDVIMTSQVFCEVVGIGLEENESSESETNDYSPNEPRVHRNTKHSGLVNVHVSVGVWDVYYQFCMTFCERERRERESKLGEGNRERERERERINLPSSSQPG